MREMIKLLEPHFIELMANLACGSGIQIPMGVLLSKDIVFDKALKEKLYRIN